MSNGIVNPELQEKTRILLRSALGLLTTFVEEGESIPERIKEVHKIVGPGGWSKDYEPRPESSIFIYRHSKEIEGLPEYSPWLQAMRADPVVSRHLDSLVGTSQGGIRRTAFEYLLHMLVKQVQLWPARFDEDAFDRSYRDMEQFFYHDTVEFRAFAPLQNFSTDADAIDLGGSLRIRKITNQELEDLLDASALGSMIPFGEIPTSFRYAMEMHYETEKIFQEFKVENLKPSPDQECFGKLLTALRLFRSGTVGFNIVQTTPTVDTPALFGGTRGGFEYKRFWGPKYALQGGEIEAFKEFWKNFGKIDLERRTPIGIAISRFNYAYERLGLEDKLIDFMISFEALFFKTGEIGENRHKLAVRVARLLASAYEDRKTIARDLTDFYDKRSKVVHGELATLQGELIEKVERYLRQSIKHFVEQPRTVGHDEILTRLDLE